MIFDDEREKSSIFCKINRRGEAAVSPKNNQSRIYHKIKVFSSIFTKQICPLTLLA